jgi:hypothetical protein
MDNSITNLRIEHYSGHPEVAKAAEHLVEAIAETKQFLKGRDNWLRDSKKLIASLWVRSDDQFRFSTKKDYFAGKNRKQVWMTPKVLELFKMMESFGWIKKTMGAIGPEVSKTGKGLSSVYRRTDLFKGLMSDLKIDDIELNEDLPLVTLSIDNSYVELPEAYLETESYHRTLEVLDSHFKLLLSSNIKDKQGNKLKDTDLRYRRRFTSDMGNGGRFYSSFCTQPKEDRLSVTFNGEPAVSLDFSQLHPTLLLLLSQGTGTETNMFSTGDVYSMPDYPDLPRSAHKKFINTIFNAESKDSAARSIATARMYLDLEEDCLAFETYSGKAKRKGIPVWINPLKEAKKYVDDFIFRHPNFKDVAYCGKWGILQLIDSQIIENVMLMANKNNVPVLPVHDEVIVPESKAKLLKHFMMVSFHSITQDKFSQFTPTITVDRLKQIL